MAGLDFDTGRRLVRTLLRVMKRCRQKAGSSKPVQITRSPLATNDSLPRSGRRCGGCSEGQRQGPGQGATAHGGEKAKRKSGRARRCRVSAPQILKGWLEHKLPRSFRFVYRPRYCPEVFVSTVRLSALSERIFEKSMCRRLDCALLVSHVFHAPFVVSFVS